MTHPHEQDRCGDQAQARYRDGKDEYRAQCDKRAQGKRDVVITLPERS